MIASSGYVRHADLAPGRRPIRSESQSRPQQTVLDVRDEAVDRLPTPHKLSQNRYP